MTVIDFTAARAAKKARTLDAVEREIVETRRFTEELEHVAAELRSEQGRLFDDQATGS